VSVGLREAAPADADAVLPLYEWLFSPPGSVPPGWDRAAGLERLRETIASPRSAVLLAADGAALVGLCSVYLDLNSVRYGLRCWVEDLAVDPARRSGGIGASLLDGARGWARSRGATHLELDSGAARSDAHRFYERERPSWTGRQYAWWLA
jgi:GNAT superfamily N-acetyltransferase